MQYILSLSNTHEWESFLTFWRPDNNGYTFYLEAAGHYPEIQKGYHDGKDAMPVTDQTVKKIWRKERVDYGAYGQTAVRNTDENLEQLGLVWIDGNLHRAIKPEFEGK